jgi:hypothetical protein
MTQNLISLNFSEADLAAIDGALAVLEDKLAGLIALTPEQRRSLAKMGDKSEAFCRQVLTLLAQNPGVLPANFDLDEARHDLANFDTLRGRFVRMRQLMEKVESSETALGSDVMSAALEGYALLKVSGKGQGLEALRQSISARFAHRARAVPAASPPNA